MTTVFFNSDQLLLEDVTTAEAGQYNVTYTDPNGCSGTGVFIITVIEITASIADVDPICPEESVTLTASTDATDTPISYAWSTGESGAAIVVSPTATTNYDGDCDRWK